MLSRGNRYMQKTLREKTLELVQSSGMSYRDLAETVGVNYQWLWRFGTCRTDVSRGDDLQRVYEYLSGHDLEVK